MGLNKMTQLSPIRTLDFYAPVSRSACPSRWLEGLRGIFRTTSPENIFRSKTSHFSSCGRVTLPIKKRCW
jgi:hypothetical protein